MQHLIDTIAYGGRYARPIITAAAADRPQPRIERESAPYLVWRGENDYWQRPFNAVRLVLENVTSGGGAALRILVEVC